MKTMFTWVALLLTTSLACAQDWERISPPGVTLYVTGTVNLEGYRYDSVTLLPGNDSLFHSFRRIIPVDGSAEADTACGSILGRRLLKLHDGTFHILNNAGDTLVLFPHAPAGAAWRFSGLPSGHMQATVTGTGTDTLLGIPDSIKTIVLQAYDSQGNPASHPLNGKDLILSRSHGLAKTLDLSRYPAHTAEYLLAGTTHPPAGIRPLNWRDIYRFHPGDVFHLRESADNHSAFGDLDQTYRIRTIQSAIWPPDSLAVTYSVTDCRQRVYIPPGGGPLADTTWEELNTEITYDLSPGGLLLPDEFAPKLFGNGEDIHTATKQTQALDPQRPGRINVTSQPYYYWKGPYTGGVWKKGPYSTYYLYLVETAKYLTGLGQTSLYHEDIYYTATSTLAYASQPGCIYGNPAYAGCETLLPWISVSADTLNFPATATYTEKLPLEAGNAWEIAEGWPGWIAVSPTSGYGNDTLALTTIADNPSVASRFGTLTLATKYPSAFRSVILVQAGKTNGTGENAGWRVSVSPNPVTSRALILVTGCPPGAQFSYVLTNTLGRIVQTGHWTGNTFTLDRAGMADGVYGLTLRMKEISQVATIKILLQHTN